MRGSVIDMSDLAGSASSEAAMRLGLLDMGFTRHRGQVPYGVVLLGADVFPGASRRKLLETLDDVSSWKELL